jgi:cytochrome c biogenesis protein CcmG, thiol:disulfide interchange protein DsbE
VPSSSRTTEPSGTAGTAGQPPDSSHAPSAKPAGSASEVTVVTTVTVRTPDPAAGGGGDGTVATPSDPSSLPRRPRRIFLLVGLVAAVVLGIVLFTVATPGSAGSVHVGGPAPTFSLPAVSGTGHVGTPADGGGNGRPAVLLFFGNWCSICHTDVPPLAAAVRTAQAAHGSLSKIAVIGVDSYDSRTAARSFASSSGVSFPVALDSVARVTNGLYDFTGDPEAVFIEGNGTISAIKFGPLSAARFVALERELVGGP